MLLQPFDAEDLFAQDLVVAPVGTRRELLDDFTEKWVQESAGLMSRRLGALREFGVLARHVFMTHGAVGLRLRARGPSLTGDGARDLGSQPSGTAASLIACFDGPDFFRKECRE